MNTEPYEGGVIPPLTMGWRLKMALAWGGVSRKVMAERLGYEETQLSRWTNDRAVPRKGVVDQWARVTGVDLTWLATGIGSPTPPDGLHAVPDEAERRRRADEGAARNRRRYGAVDVTRRYALAAA